MSSIIDDFHAIQHRLNELERAKASTAKLEPQPSPCEISRSPPAGSSASTNGPALPKLSARNNFNKALNDLMSDWHHPDSSGTYH